MPTTAADLRGLRREELESLYLAPRGLSVPRGRFRGQVLERLDSAAARRWRFRVMTELLFERTPFGIDFDRQLWFFFTPHLGLGRFSASVGLSRWRDTETVALEYQVSALPGPVRRLLYDEVKPLGPSLCLGIGGINAPRGEGELFFFLLERE